MSNQITKQVTETVSLGKVTGANKFRVRIIKAGKGSTGTYTENALENSGPLAFPAGTHSHFDHQNYQQNAEGSVKDLIGVIASTPEYVIEEDGIGALYATLEIDEAHAGFVEKFKEFLGVSIACNSIGWEDENGEFIVEAFVPSVLNRLDVVTAAGANGTFLEAVSESYRNRDILDTDEHLSNRKDDGMKPEEITQVAEALAEALKPSFATLTEALTPKAPEKDAEEVEGPSTADVTEALIEANLPKAARTKVFEAVNAGSTVEDAIKAETEYIRELSEAAKGVEAPSGEVRTSKDAVASGPIAIPGWGN